MKSWEGGYQILRVEVVEKFWGLHKADREAQYHGVTLGIHMGTTREGWGFEACGGQVKLAADPHPCVGCLKCTWRMANRWNTWKEAVMDWSRVSLSLQIRLQSEIQKDPPKVWVPYPHEAIRGLEALPKDTLMALEAFEIPGACMLGVFPEMRILASPGPATREELWSLLLLAGIFAREEKESGK